MPFQSYQTLDISPSLSSWYAVSVLPETLATKFLLYLLQYRGVSWQDVSFMTRHGLPGSERRNSRLLQEALTFNLAEHHLEWSGAPPAPQGLHVGAWSCHHSQSCFKIKWKAFSDEWRNPQSMLKQAHMSVMSIFIQTMFASARRLRFHHGWIIKEDNDRITLIIIVITDTAMAAGTKPLVQNHIKAFIVNVSYKRCFMLYLVSLNYSDVTRSLSGWCFLQQK